MNVGFKRGTQASLNTLKTNVKNGTASFAEGSFYLTSDSDRLYFAQSANELVDLNQYVRTVASVSALPTTTSDPSLQAGDFYYALNDNVFCIRNNTNTAWTQINPDTYLKSTTTAVSVTAKTGGGATVTTAVSDSQDNIATGNFSIVGGTDITVTNSGNVITIDSNAQDTTYTIGTDTNANQGDITLTPSSGTGTAIAIKSNNTDILTVSSNNKNEVILKPVDQTTKTVTNAFDANGKFTTTVTDVEDHTSAAVTPTITYGTGASASQTFKNGTAALDVYTTAQTDAKIDSEITKKLKAADAMHFAGTCGTQGTVTTLPGIKTVSNGTTYKLVSDITTPVKAFVGDLVVAFGTEDASTGLITSGSWLVVPSGDDQSLIGEATTTTVTIKDSAADEQVAAITVQGSSSNPVTVTGVVGTDPAHTTFTVAHKELTTKVGTKTGSTSNVTQSTASTASFTALTKLVVDDYGHVTSADTKKITVTDTHNAVTAVNMLASGGDAEAVGGTAVITSAVTTTDEGTMSGTMNMVSSTLAVSGTTATANGTQVGTVTVDLIWGTF